MTDKFHHRFNIEIATDEAKRRFVNRAHNLILYDIEPKVGQTFGLTQAQEMEQFICVKLGDRWVGFGCLPTILGDDFYKHIQTLEALYEYPNTRASADIAVRRILDESEIDLGIRWDNGHFLPSGAPLLDEKLVNDVLGHLGSRQYVGVLAAFQKGLDHFLHSLNKPEFLFDVITDMHEALEALAKIVTGRDKDLSSNAELFIAKLSVSEEYKPILKLYISYANTLARHSAKMGQGKALPSRQEVESFIYLTGLFLRLAMQ